MATTECPAPLIPRNRLEAYKFFQRVHSGADYPTFLTGASWATSIIYNEIMPLILTSGNITDNEGRIAGILERIEAMVGAEIGPEEKTTALRNPDNDD